MRLVVRRSACRTIGAIALPSARNQDSSKQVFIGMQAPRQPA
jgi:hypothetical protein